MAIGGNYQIALWLIFGAAILDMVDGRIARFTKNESRFGAELDSIADFLNFGIAPAFAIWMWQLNILGNFGWVLAFFFVMCCALRLARFNASLDEESSGKHESGKPESSKMGKKDFFIGVPAPAGGLLAFMPLVLYLLDFVSHPVVTTFLAMLFLIGAGLLMISRLPTFSLKRLRLRIPRHNFLPILLIVMVVGSLIFNYSLLFLLTLGLVYLISIPFSIWKYHHN